MDMKKGLTAAAALIFTASVAFNVYSAYRIHDLTTVVPADRDAGTTAALIQGADRLEREYNNSGSLNMEELYGLRQNLLKLPDVMGTLAFIKSSGGQDGMLILHVDEVEWFSGDEAEAAAKEDGVPETGSLANGFYIRNASEELKHVTLDQDVQIDVLDGAMLKQTSLQDFSTAELTDRLFHITTAGGKAVLLEEQYRP
ncbi:hypothetical protein D3C73_984350 [compost metagenome]